MKIILTKSNKILIGVTVSLYVIGLIFGGWSILINLIFLVFALTVIRKSQLKGALSTFHLVILLILVGASLLIKLGFFLQQYNDYKVKKEYEKKIAAEITPIPSEFPTPTEYICPTVDKKTQTDIEAEAAENNLSSYEIKEQYSGLEEKITRVDILEKKLLTPQPYDELYSQLSNQKGDTSWTIKYPKEWKLYRIKRRLTEKRNEAIPQEYYDLKFEHLSSYFYLRESVTLGGQPIIISENQSKLVKKNCSVPFSKLSNNNEDYLCSGNIINCVINDYMAATYPINSYYKSLLSVNETSIYDWYIPSILFDRDLSNERALRIYTLSDNFYSNDEQFIAELKKIYISLQGVNK